MIKVSGHITRVMRNQDGGMMLAFGFLLPILVGISFGAIEISTLMFDYHRAGEATRRAARVVAINEPIADLSAFARGSLVSCQGQSGGGVTCTGASVSSAATFTQMLSEIQEIQPAIQSENISVIYQDSGLGDPATPGGILPLVVVQVSNLQRPLMVIGGFMGMPENFTFPAFLTTQMANGIGNTS